MANGCGATSRGAVREVCLVLGSDGLAGEPIVHQGRHDGILAGDLVMESPHRQRPLRIAVSGPIEAPQFNPARCGSRHFDGAGRGAAVA